ncbi:hypothetical protein ACKU5B_028025 [Klebsiella pneumoniae]
MTSERIGVDILRSLSVMFGGNVMLAMPVPAIFVSRGVLLS